ncbi:BZ3500_MvSof-1268-A1-R1_Chr3-1g05499 [Microbotryum saponariae]|uniref:BZ3500_MvSof-1268-A1-R1_Chr3-1g05499 protein n=1 Tax=Microbotryum saponariae TaxID=289078 RepID=A0A2X0KWX2_9BASI|nr:BZ3500_MvSof-1268-A1-R1_Chr3-1g05499 [Microbotryum saponariae]SDA04690.1 BZ3501_MvSof-1269-A2-R1_Chr3-1g05170 [Microbotryum saponariae]
MGQAARASSPAAQPADLALRTVHVDDSDENISPSWSRRIVLVQAEETEEGEWEEGEMASQPSLSPVGARPIELPNRDGPRVLSSDRGNMPSQGSLIASKASIWTFELRGAGSDLAAYQPDYRDFPDPATPLIPTHRSARAPELSRAVSVSRRALTFSITTTSNGASFSSNF